MVKDNPIINSLIRAFDCIFVCLVVGSFYKLPQTAMPKETHRFHPQTRNQEGVPNFTQLREGRTGKKTIDMELEDENAVIWSKIISVVPLALWWGKLWFLVMARVAAYG